MKGVLVTFIAKVEGVVKEKFSEAEPQTPTFPPPNKIPGGATGKVQWKDLMDGRLGVDDTLGGISLKRFVSQLKARRFPSEMYSRRSGENFVFLNERNFSEAKVVSCGFLHSNSVLRWRR